MFDEEPDDPDPHGQCAAEIHRLDARVSELESFLFKWCDIDHMGAEELAFFDEIRKRVIYVDPIKPPF